MNGNASTQIIYRAGQDAGHNSPATITLSGAPGLSASGGLLQGIYIDGNYNGNRNLSINGDLGAAGSTAWNNVRLSYITMDDTTIGGTTFQSFELDHCNVALPAGKDHFFTSSASAGDIGYASNTILDNVIQVSQVNDGSGHGSDGFQWIENATISGNSVYSVFNSTANSQHLDFFQTAGDYLDFHDNYFENAGNYPIYGDYFGNVSHWRIYNNVFAEYSGHGTGISQQAMGIGFDGGVSGHTINDIIIVNNTCYAQDSGHLCVDLNNGATGDIVTNAFIENNVAYNTDFFLTPGSGGLITSLDDVTGTSKMAFVSTAAYPNGNWNLTSGATSAIGQGANLTGLGISSLDVDAAGTNRPSTGAWDLGAYEFSSQQGGTPPSGASGLSASTR